MFWSPPTRSLLLLLFIGPHFVSAQQPQESTAAASEEAVAAEASTPARSEESPPTPIPSAAAEAPGGPFEVPEDYHKEFSKRVDTFQARRRELERALGDQRDIYVRFVNRENASREAKDAYYEQRQRVREALDETFDAALEVLRMGVDAEAATYLVTMVQHRFEHDIYDEPTMEAAARLIDGGSKLTYLYKAAARSAIVTGKFDMAKRLLESIDEDQMEEIDMVLRANLDDYKRLYEADVPIREKEAAEDKLPRVAMKTTQGDAVIELFLNQAPSTVSHFIRLVEEGFYDEVDFHQVIDHRLALTGDRTGLGSGNCGKFLIDEHERDDAREAFRGSLVMAKLPMGETGKFVPHSASSQFAILFLPVISASEEQTVFGRVIEGMDAISRLRRVDPSKKKDKGEIVQPPDRIIEMSVIRRPETLPEPEYFDLRRQ